MIVVLAPLALFVPMNAYYPMTGDCQIKYFANAKVLQMASDKYPTKITENIGLRIREARKEKFRKSYIFARVMQVEPATVTNWEKGRISFTADHLYELAKYLDVSPAWLLTGEGEMEIKKEPTHEEKTAIDD